MNISNLLRHTFVFGMLLIFSCKPEPKKLNLQEFMWLQGTWITQDSSSIESWAFQNNEWIGNVYAPKVGKITENLRIYQEGSDLIYEAKVVNQNNGNGVQFKMESTSADSLHFVNMSHDFPNQIDYFKTSDSTLFCNVYGKQNEGKGFEMKKLKE